MDEKDIIKDRIDIIDLINEYIPLKPAGKNYKALCPFHNEKTPSFVVSQDKKMWHCFGCGEGGDHFTFLMKMDGLEFREALEKLAERAGVTLTHSKQRSENKDQGSIKLVLLQIHEIACEYFRAGLKKSQSSRAVKDYLSQRGINDEIIEKYKIGFIGNTWDALKVFLNKKGYNDNILIRAGLLVKNEHGKVYDRFRHRIIFPIFNLDGKVTAFGGRTVQDIPSIAGKNLVEKPSGKYINSPETEIYNKSKTLYGLNFARSEIRTCDSVIVCEGYTDVILSQMHGFLNTVSVSGTSLTRDQLRILKRYTENIYFCFDDDEAGLKATLRALELSKDLNLVLKIILLSKGMDPADLILTNEKKWEEAYKYAKSTESFLPKVFKKIFPSPAKALRTLAEKIDLFTDPLQRETFIKNVSETFGISANIFHEYIEKRRVGKKSSENTPQTGDENEKTIDYRTKLEVYFLALLISGKINPREKVFMKESHTIQHKKLSELLTFLRSQFTKNNPVAFQKISDRLSDENLISYFRKLVMEMEINKDVSEEKINFHDEAVKVYNKLTTLTRRQKKEELIKKLRASEKQKNFHTSKKILEELQAIS